MDCVRQTEGSRASPGWQSGDGEREKRAPTHSFPRSDKHPRTRSVPRSRASRLLINISIPYVSICGYAQLSSDFAEVNKWALVLMKSCCQRRCGSGTVRAPRGCSNRLGFCITLNPKVWGINLTLLWETKESPLTWYNNTKQKNLCLSSCHVL